MSNKTKIDTIIKAVKNKIRPDITVIKEVDNIVIEINNLLKKDNISAECVKGGSIAKETFLKDDYDIDLFIRYNITYRDSDISFMTSKILDKLCKKIKTQIVKIHGSRDYYQFNIIKNKKILAFEVIPVLLIHASNYSDAQNITDLSPEHVTWVKKYTTKKPELIEDIRVAKQFCKANKVYGAESYINGFSGHILDILIIHHGSFINLINTFSKYEYDDLKKPIIIDTEKNLPNPLIQLNKNKITPLIIIDPIQKDRNSAAALNKEKLWMFILASKEFIKNPSKDFFVIHKFNIDDEIKKALKKIKIDKKELNIIKLIMKTVDGSKDVVGTKALKAHTLILEQLELNDFKIYYNGWNFIYDKKYAESFIIIDKKISEEISQQGPPINSTINYNKFIEKHKDLKHKITLKNNRAYATIPRKFTDPKKLIEEITKQDFISKRIEKLSIK
ncbi:MAG: nucleotidyltransferase domain-containing protein [Candidatus Woesearchaeota archaeon]